MLATQAGQAGRRFGAACRQSAGRRPAAPGLLRETPAGDGAGAQPEKAARVSTSGPRVVRRVPPRRAARDTHVLSAAGSGPAAPGHGRRDRRRSSAQPGAHGRRGGLGIAWGTLAPRRRAEKWRRGRMQAACTAAGIPRCPGTASSPAPAPAQAARQPRLHRHAAAARTWHRPCRPPARLPRHREPPACTHARTHARAPPVPSLPSWLSSPPCRSPHPAVHHHHLRPVLPL